MTAEAIKVPAKLKTSSFRQVEIQRAVKAVMKAGINISEVIATRNGVRIVAAGGQASAVAGNSWDEVLDDG